VYSYIQKRYWNVILMTFTGQRSIPSLVYLLPLYSLFFLAYKFLYKNYHQNTKATSSFLLKFLDILRMKPMEHIEEFMIPHHLLLFLLSGIGLAMIHFNSVSRLLSGYPLMYIVLTVAVCSIEEGNKKMWKAWMLFWMIGFQLIVSCFAVNFYMPF
jgi:hypothetical protein